MYIVEDNQKYISLINALKKLNKENILLNEQLSNGRLKKSFLRYLTHLEFRQIFNRLRIYLYEKKNRNRKNEILTKKNEPDYFSEYKIAIYTGIYGSYDNIYEPMFVPDNCDFIIFTDQETDPNSKWKKREIKDDFFHTLNNAQKNRYVKMNPHKILDDYEYSVYIDGSVITVTDLTELINKVGKYGFAMHRHSSRDCVYEELNAAKIYKKIDNEMINTYNKVFNSQNMPFHYGMLECGVIAREHNNKLCIDIMEQWWKYYFDYGGRDQLWLPLVLFKNKIDIQDVSQLGDNIYHNYAFRIMQHC